MFRRATPSLVSKWRPSNPHVWVESPTPLSQNIAAFHIGVCNFRCHIEWSPQQIIWPAFVWKNHIVLTSPPDKVSKHLHRWTKSICKSGGILSKHHIWCDNRMKQDLHVSFRFKYLCILHAVFSIYIFFWMLPHASCQHMRRLHKCSLMSPARAKKSFSGDVCGNSVWQHLPFPSHAATATKTTTTPATVRRATSKTTMRTTTTTTAKMTTRSPDQDETNDDNEKKWQQSATTTTTLQLNTGSHQPNRHRHRHRLFQQFHLHHPYFGQSPRQSFEFHSNCLSVAICSTVPLCLNWLTFQFVSSGDSQGKCCTLFKPDPLLQEPEELKNNTVKE